jgi:hypothetical protein
MIHSNPEVNKQSAVEVLIDKLTTEMDEAGSDRAELIGIVAKRMAALSLGIERSPEEPTDSEPELDPVGEHIAREVAAIALTAAAAIPAVEIENLETERSLRRRQLLAALDADTLHGDAVRRIELDIIFRSHPDQD